MRSLVFLLILSGIAVPAWAQDSAKKTEPSATLNADTFRLPSSAYDTSKFDYSPPNTGNGGFRPGRFDLGSSVLEIDTRKQEPTNRVGIETVDPKLLGGIAKDSSSPLPNYFGMTLSKPLN